MKTLCAGISIVATLALAGCGGSGGRSVDDAEGYLSVQLEDIGDDLGVRFSDVTCDGSGSSFECRAFNSLTGEEVYDVTFRDGEWEHHARD